MCVLNFFIRESPNQTVLLAMETLRVYRPRVVLHGSVGMGQAFIASAALHHLEGFHVQSLDLGNLLSDSTRVRASFWPSFTQFRSQLSPPDPGSRDSPTLRRS